VLADTIPGIRVVKAFAQERREANRFRDANKHNLAVNDRINFVWSLFSPTVTLMTEVAAVGGVGLWYLVGVAPPNYRRCIDCVLGLHRAFLYTSRFHEPYRLAYQKAAAGAKRIFEILDHVSSVPETTHPQQLPSPLQGRIDIQDVGFRYGNRAVIRGLNLAIQPGEMIGLVGQSGSGKSTLVNLICRFYDISEGAIKVDGIDIRNIALSDYRSHIGLVLQEPFSSLARLLTTLRMASLTRVVKT
jgi:ATP-binding cassette subfamily B protein